MSKRKYLTKEIKEYVVKVYTENTTKTNKIKAEIVNDKFGTTFNESAFRKYFKAYSEGLNDGIKEQAPDKQLERLAGAELKVQLERKKLQFKRYTLNKEITDSAVKDEIKRMVEESFKNVEVKDFKKYRQLKGESDLFIFGDEQYNGYAAGRTQLELTFSYISAYSTSKRLLLLLTGDMIEGLHRASTALSVKKVTSHQAIDYQSIFLAGVLRLVAQGHEVDIKMVTSNHTNRRELGYETPRDDEAYHIAAYLRLAMRYNPGIKSVEIDDVLTFDDNGKRFALLHGHQKYAGNKKSLENALFKMLGYLPDFIVMGHYHQFKITKEGKYTLIVAPAAKVTQEEYERDAGYVHEPAMLKLTTYAGSQDFSTRIIHFGKKMEITNELAEEFK